MLPAMESVAVDHISSGSHPTGLVVGLVIGLVALAFTLKPMKRQQLQDLASLGCWLGAAGLLLWYFLPTEKRLWVVLGAVCFIVGCAFKVRYLVTWKRQQAGRGFLMRAVRVRLAYLLHLVKNDQLQRDGKRGLIIERQGPRTTIIWEDGTKTTDVALEGTAGGAFAGGASGIVTVTSSPVGVAASFRRLLLKGWRLGL